MESSGGRGLGEALHPLIFYGKPSIMVAVGEHYTSLAARKDEHLFSENRVAGRVGNARQEATIWRNGTDDKGLVSLSLD
jgi:hypothetical protein